MITISQDALRAALNAVTRASQKTSSLPAFSLVRLDADAQGQLSLSCFNGESAARAITCRSPATKTSRSAWMRRP